MDCQSCENYKPKQPTPKYRVGDWIVVDNGKPIQIERISNNIACWVGDSWVNVADIEVNGTVRPATREDFMVGFDGVRVWMEDYRDDPENPTIVAVHLVAGVMFIPKEYQ